MLDSTKNAGGAQSGTTGADSDSPAGAIREGAVREGEAEGEAEGEDT